MTMQMEEGNKDKNLTSLLYQLRLLKHYPPEIHPMHAPLIVEPSDLGSGDTAMDASQKKLPFPVSYGLACLTSSARLCKWCLPETFFALLHNTPPDLALEGLERMSSAGSPLVACEDACELLRGIIAELVQEDEEGSEGGQDTEPSTTALVTTRTAHVTPTRTVFCPPEVERSNRVLRHWNRLASHFLRVTFTLGEDLVFKAPGFAGTDAIYSRIHSIMNQGIWCGSRHYQFLAFSSSQIREASCWMFAAAGTTDADAIRSWMGNFEGLRVVAKCAARMGQCFSR